MSNVKTDESKDSGILSRAKKMLDDHLVCPSPPTPHFPSPSSRHSLSPSSLLRRTPRRTPPW